MKINKAWIVLGVCCGLAAASMGVMINSYGAFYTPVAESLGVMKGAFTLHVTIGSLVASFLALSIGKLLYKVKNFKLIFIFGAGISALATLGFSVANNLWMFYILGFIRGLGVNFIAMIPLTIIIGNWFKKSHGLATSIVMSFSGIAGAIGTPLFTSLIISSGWQNAYRVMAILIIVLCLPAILYPFKLKPEEEGLLPYGYDEAPVVQKTIEPIKNKEYFNPMQVTFIAYVIAAIFMTATTFVAGYFPGYAASIGLGAVAGSLMTSAAMIGNICSKLLIGTLSDKIGPFKASIIMLASNLVALIVILFTNNQFIMIASAFFFGSMYSMGSVGIPLLCKEFFGEENYSEAFPIVSFFTGIAGAFATSLIGFIFDFTGTYKVVFALFIATHIIIYISLLIISKKSGKHVFHKDEIKA
ncbi:MAG: MFS transporter [Erysipelotrichaceae bacterium]|nr:MFS transporter [Erysipelotrichaceae bacterium]